MPGDVEGVPRNETGLYVQSQLDQSMTIHANLDTSVVVTSRDRIKNVLHEKLPGHRRRYGWPGPLGVAVTLWITLFTATFRQVFGISGEAIFGAVALLAVASTAYLVRVVWRRRSGVDVNGLADAISNTHNPDAGSVIAGE